MGWKPKNVLEHKVDFFQCKWLGSAPVQINRLYVSLCPYTFCKNFITIAKTVWLESYEKKVFRTSDPKKID